MFNWHLRFTWFFLGGFGWVQTWDLNDDSSINIWFFNTYVRNLGVFFEMRGSFLQQFFWPQSLRNNVTWSGWWFGCHQFGHFPIHIGLRFNHPNWLTPSFFRGGLQTTNQVTWCTWCTWPIFRSMRMAPGDDIQQKKRPLKEMLVETPNRVDGRK